MELFQYISIYLLHQFPQPLGGLHFQNKTCKKINALKLIIINGIPTSPPPMCTLHANFPIFMDQSEIIHANVHWEDMASTPHSKPLQNRYKIWAQYGHNFLDEVITLNKVREKRKILILIALEQLNCWFEI